MLAVIDGAKHSLSDRERGDGRLDDHRCASVAAARRGVKVDVTMTRDSSYDSDWSAIVSAGGHVHLYNDGYSDLYIHAKTTIADAGFPDQRIYVGSINFSRASMDDNRELGVITTDAKIVNAINVVVAGDIPTAPRPRTAAATTDNATSPRWVDTYSKPWERHEDTGKVAGFPPALEPRTWWRPSGSSPWLGTLHALCLGPRAAPTQTRSIGVAAEQGETVVDALIANGQRIPDRPAMRYCPAERRSEGEWKSITWAEYLLAARQIAAGLAELGVGRGGRVAILSANRVEWHLADLGTLLNGAVTVPVYPTSSPSQVAYILGHAEVEVCLVDTRAQLAKLVGFATGCRP